MITGAAVKWHFQRLASEVVTNDKKADLSKSVKIVCIDKFHNQTILPADIVPIVTIEHDR